MKTIMNFKLGKFLFLGRKCPENIPMGTFWDISLFNLTLTHVEWMSNFFFKQHKQLEVDC